MKTTILYLLLFFNLTSYSQWIQPSQLTQRNTLQKIATSDSLHTWAVGDTGIIIFSSDQGRTWILQNSGTRDQLLTVYFVDSIKGWAAGANSALLTTANGGLTWEKLTLGVSGLSLRSIHFINKYIGWIAASPTSGTPALLYRTTDAGSNWQQVTLPPTVNTAIFNVQFTDTLNGWLRSINKLYRTSNGGTDWDVFDNYGNIYTQFRDFQFLTTRKGFCLIDLYSKIYMGRTNDGGQTWSFDSAFTPMGGGTRASIHFADSLYGCATGPVFVAVTTDGGVNWNVTKRTPSPFINSIRIIGRQNIVCVGMLGFKLISSDQGKTWIDNSPPTPMTLSKIKYQTKNILWAIGGKSILLQSLDGGLTWQRNGIPSGIGLSSMSFPDSLHGWVLDDSARIFRTTDLGKNWATQSTGLNSGLLGLFFCDSTFGCAVGLSGATRVTSNGGAVWNSVVNASSNTLNDVMFVNRNAGWAVGIAGTIVRAYDSGKSWKLLNCPTTTTLRSVSFSDTLHGTIIGDSGIMLVTTDGGTTWTIQQFGNGILCRGVKMLGTAGWIVGDSGKVQSTTDFGAIWKPQKTEITTALYGVDFITGDIGTIVGEGTTVLVTRNGGFTYTPDRPITSNVQSFQLENNFPNPFNPSTTINYSISQSSHVVINIYNPLGQHIASLVNDKKGKGDYSILWEPTNLSSGIYYYRLETNGSSSVKKMVYLR